MINNVLNIYTIFQLGSNNLLLSEKKKSKLNIQNWKTGSTEEPGELKVQGVKLNLQKPQSRSEVGPAVPSSSYEKGIVTAYIDTVLSGYIAVKVPEFKVNQQAYCKLDEIFNKGT